MADSLGNAIAAAMSGIERCVKIILAERDSARLEVDRLRGVLEQVREKDGPGADGSPAGPCYDIAENALRGT
jgi:hypothetical protein